jgi:glycosyltransferase involved in cell wall biosynthesis
MRKEKGLIIIPAYNEEKTILKLIDKIKTVQPDLDIVVIDDCSSDQTFNVLIKANVTVISLPCNLGYGGALQTGFKYAHEKNYHFVITIDADGQHDPESIKTLIDEMKKNSDVDMIIGSRFLVNNSEYKASIPRQVGINLLRWIIRVFAKEKISDPTSGFQLLQKNIIELYATKNFYPKDYPDADLIILLHLLGFTIKEVPVIMHENTTGKSMHSGVKSIFYFLKLFLSLYILLSSERKHIKVLK